MPDTANAKLFELMVPGLLHGMGNALFAIQARAQVMAEARAQVPGEDGEDNEGDADEILPACRNASAVLDVLRLLTTAAGKEPSIPAGSALRGLLEPMRIGLRDTSVSIEVDPESFDADDAVPHRLFARAVGLAAAEICDAVPTGCRGVLQFRWMGARVLRVAFVGAADQLPFEADITAAERNVASWFADTDGRVGCEDGGLVMHFPEAADG
jgi:hypothetical protein